MPLIDDSGDQQVVTASIHVVGRYEPVAISG